MKRFHSFIHKLLLVLAVVTVSVVFEGCGEVVDKTIDEIKYIPAQMFATRETAETAQVDAEMISPESAV